MSAETYLATEVRRVVAPGTRERPGTGEFHTVATDIGDYVPMREFDALPDDEKAEVLSDLREIHAARVALASLDADRLAKAERWLADNAWSRDLDAQAAIIRAALSEIED